MVEIFRTNVHSHQEAKFILDLLSRKYPHLEINFDLDDCDKILRIKGEAYCRQDIIEILWSCGLECDPIS